MDQGEIARWARAAEILDEILELPKEQQSAAVEKLGGAAGVQNELSALLAGSNRASLLDESLDEVLGAVPNPRPAPGALRDQVLGNWILGDEIGQGGMSVVYQASRTGQDFQQHAAVKILSVGHLGKDFVESFLRERQILSDLHHPGIARLIDGGISDEGAPYLVMQYVKGERIDLWCKNRNLDVAAIVRLMLKLCDATAYAQRRLIVHQDINPSNVLVDEHGQPVLIDFGIARLLGQVAESGTIRAFTPNFGAPEQRDGNAITTATDVYGLGKLFDALVRDKVLDTDLASIITMATQPDPEKRYPNARAFAVDLQAWLERRPVLAHPSTPGYRLGRFMARNRLAVAAAAAVMLSLLVGLGLTTWQARVAAAERDLAQVEKLRALEATRFLKDLFRASDPDRAQGRETTARELLDQGVRQAELAFAESPQLRAEMLLLLGGLYSELGEHDAAAPLLVEGLQIADRFPDVEMQAEARSQLAKLRMETGEHETALQLVTEAESVLRDAGKVPGAKHATLMEPMLFSLAELGRAPEATQLGEQALAAARSKPGLPDSALYDYLYSLANVLLIAERDDEAEPLLFEAAALDIDSMERPTVQIALQSNLSSVLESRGDLTESIEHSQAALDLVERIYPPDHSERARKLSNLATLYNAAGRFDDAEQLLTEALSIYQVIYGDEAHPRVAAAHNNLGRTLHGAGRFAAADPQLVRARDMAGTLFGKDDPRYAFATSNLGAVRQELGDYDSADALYEESLEIKRAVLGPDHPSVGLELSLIAGLRLVQERHAEALDLTEETQLIYQQANYSRFPALLANLTRQAQALAGLGKPDEAREAFSKAFSLAEKTGIADMGSKWPDLLAAHAEFLINQGDPGAAAETQRALEALQATFGEAHPSTLRLREFANRNRAQNAPDSVSEPALK